VHGERLAAMSWAPFVGLPVAFPTQPSHHVEGPACHPSRVNLPYLLEPATTLQPPLRPCLTARIKNPGISQSSATSADLDAHHCAAHTLTIAVASCLASPHNCAWSSLSREPALSSLCPDSTSPPSPPRPEQPWPTASRHCLVRRCHGKTSTSPRAR
jgi:hypothetical protein